MHVVNRMCKLRGFKEILAVTGNEWNNVFNTTGKLGLCNMEFGKVKIHNTCKMPVNIPSGIVDVMTMSAFSM